MKPLENLGFFDDFSGNLSKILLIFEAYFGDDLSGITK